MIATPRFALCAAAYLPFVAAEVSAAAPPPKLVVVIAVDQLSADLFDAYRPNWRAGMARLAKGTVFRNGYQAQSATETCPGHSTITTGAYPSRSGVVANNWVDLSVEREDKVIYCAEDERVRGSTSANYTVSAAHLLIPTLGERLKTLDPESRSVAVSGKDRAAIMLSGHQVDRRYYWGSASFVTDRKGEAEPVSVTRVNQAAASLLSMPAGPIPLPAVCQSKSKAVRIADSDKSVGTGRFRRNADDANAFRASPELDRQTLALASGLVDDLKLGRGSATDTLSLSLSATDYVGHAFGNQGAEMCIQLLELDAMLGAFLNGLDDRKIDFLVALTADHGGLDIPERARLAGNTDAMRADTSLSPGRVGLELVEKLGLSGFGLQGEGAFGDTYVDRSLPAEDRQRLLDAAVAYYRAHPLVAAVFTADELRGAPMPASPPDQWTLRDRARANFFPARSGDFIVLLKKDVTPIWETSRYIATHGSPWDYDRRVPILFYRPGQAGSNVERAVATVDILPTLAGAVGLKIADGDIDGRCLPEFAGACGAPSARGLQVPIK